jgi:hypothetical protein
VALIDFTMHHPFRHRPSRAAHEADAIFTAAPRGNLIKERVAERRLMRDYIPTIQTIAVGFGLIGVAQALRLLLVIFDWEGIILRAQGVQL